MIIKKNSPSVEPQTDLVVISQVASERRQLGEDIWGGISSRIIWYHLRSSGVKWDHLGGLCEGLVEVSGRSMGSLWEVSGRTLASLWEELWRLLGAGRSRKQLLKYLSAKNAKVLVNVNITKGF